MDQETDAPEIVRAVDCSRPWLPLLNKWQSEDLSGGFLISSQKSYLLTDPFLSLFVLNTFLFDV